MRKLALTALMLALPLLTPPTGANASGWYGRGYGYYPYYRPYGYYPRAYYYYGPSYFRPYF